MVVGYNGRPTAQGSQGSIPPDPATQAQALRAKQILTAVAGEGTLDIALLNAEHGIMVIENSVLQQT